MDQMKKSDKEDIEREALVPQSTTTFTVTDAIEFSGFRKFQYVSCAICGLSWIASSTLIMLLAILGPSLKCEWQLSTVEQALCTTFVFAGWMVASPVWGRICDIYGRRKGLIATAAAGFIFGIFTVFSPSFYVFLACRFGVGFAVAGQAQSITHTSEFLPSANRAKWMIILKSFFAIGTAILTGLAIFILPNFGWRWLVAYAAFPMGFFGICCWWLPESARFDVAQGKIVEVSSESCYENKPKLFPARATLERIARFNGSSLPDGELVAENQESSSSNMVDLLKPSHRRTTIQLWFMWTLFGLLYYGVAIYTTLLLHSPADQCGVVDDHSSRVKRGAVVEPCRHLTSENYIDIIVTTMSEVPGYILTMYAVDIIGRRATFAIGFAIVSACSAALTICLPRFLTVTALFVCRSAIGAVFQAGYIYTSEVYPTSLRAQGLGVASGFGRFGSMITPLITRILFAHNLVFPAIVYVIGGIVGAVLSILLPIETRTNRVSKAVKTSQS
ncbi:hypothetical protein PRIPAC_77824 [Pristionchus pacificus]|uniref:Membrane transporter n=1 Tax=Pristionchus pacificus TaxID=54126 RepID=A0A2A6C4B3_PRIPA|nr:hypothetical protein PRIPAC_77824 [Pristionchus pacificus]|eukprot:PDM72947.1 membrane transporter [Pristionchus pacificus]